MRRAPPQSLASLVAPLEALAQEAGNLALTHFCTANRASVEEKGHLDLVTRADREVEALLRRRLQQLCPDDAIYGEEGTSVAGTSGRTWVLDPIDGTFNFVRGGADWAVSIGLYEAGRPAFGVIHAPVRRTTLSGGGAVPAHLNGAPLPALTPPIPGRGSIGVGFHPQMATEARLDILRCLWDDMGVTIRCSGSSSMSIVDVARGETDAYVALGDATWDVMAALPILRSLGGTDTIDWSRTRLTDRLRFACGRVQTTQRILDLARI